MLATATTSIPLLVSVSEGSFGLLLDPHTGIRLPNEIHEGVTTASHVSLNFIVETNDELHPEYCICFDQAFHRRHELSRPEQMQAKVAFLRTRGIRSFYYVSHAPFLFTASNAETLHRIRHRLVDAGIPAHRFEPHIS